MRIKMLSFSGETQTCKRFYYYFNTNKNVFLNLNKNWIYGIFSLKMRRTKIMHTYLASRPEVVKSEFFGGENA